MWLPDRRSFLALAACGGACGFRPALKGGEGVVGDLNGQFGIAVEGRREGFLLDGFLRDRLGEPAFDPPYELSVTLEFETRESAAPGPDGEGRQTLSGTASFEIASNETGRVLESGEVSSWTSWSTSHRTASLLAARSSARDRVTEQLAERIVTRILHARAGWAN